MGVPIKPGEGGMLSQNITLELGPMAGRLITPVTAEIQAIFVPAQAVDYILDPNAAYAGMTEVVREKLLAGGWDVQENDNEIAQRCMIDPVSIDGAKKVSRMVRVAHAAAINYLRLRRYHAAPLAVHGQMTPSKAIVSESLLKRFNAVLDPDDRINGAVDLQLPTMSLPVEGIGTDAGATAFSSNISVKETGGETQSFASAVPGNGSAPNRMWFEQIAGVPQIFAKLNGATAGNVSLTDFYNAEKMDGLVRTMQQIIEENPEHGQEMVLRWAHGLTVDVAKTPFILYEDVRVFGRNLVSALDTAGVEADTVRSDMAIELGFNVPIPTTELGGCVITFVTIKPDETYGRQPHPIGAYEFKLSNYAADQLKLDPVAVTMRQLDMDVAQASESTVAFYTGHNALLQNFVSYGISKAIDANTLDNKTQVWQIKLPLNAADILYPTVVGHEPFNDQAGDCCTATVASAAVVLTPEIFGPTPVETLAVIDTENLFEV